MTKPKSVSQILLSTWLLIHNGDFSSSTLITSLNWFEAQVQCHKHNDTLPINTSFTSPVMEFWSGFYHRQIFWIKILGCYDSRNMQGNPEFQMIFSSVGFCHEICTSVNSTIFGIKKTKCTCLEPEILATSISSTDCNETCHKDTEGVRFLECGGPNAYSVYTADATILLNKTETESDRKPACLAIDCGTMKAFSISFACSELYYGVCEDKGYLGCFENQWNRVLGDRSISEELMTVDRCKYYCSKGKTTFYGVVYGRECYCGDVLRTRNRKPESECNMKCSGDANQICGGSWRINIYRNPYNEIDMDAKQNWTESMKWCKKWSMPTYLYGNISSTNASLTCDTLHRNKAGLSWLGIAKEVYIGYDQGFPVDDDQRGSFIQCQKCNQTDCVFVDCFNKLTNVLCNKGAFSICNNTFICEYPLSKPTMNYEGQLICKDTNEQVFHKFEQKSPEKYEEGDAEALQVVSIIIAVILGIIFALIFTYLCQRKTTGKCQVKVTGSNVDCDNYVTMEIQEQEKNIYDRLEEHR